MNPCTQVAQSESPAPSALSGERLLLAHEAGGVACFEYDPATESLRTTQVGQSLLDLPGETVSLAWLRDAQILPEADWQALASDFRHALTQHLDIERTVEFHSGEERLPGWLLLKAAVRPDPDSGRDIITGTLQDITCQKSDCDAIRDLARMLSDAERLAGAFAWELDVASDTFSVSPNWLALLNLPAGTNPVRGMLLSALVPQDRELVEAKMATAIAQNQAFDLEITADLEGRERHLHLYAQPITDSTGNVSKLIGAVRDITALVTARKALAESEAQFRQFMDSVPASAFVKNEDHVFEYLNRAMTKVGAGRELKFEQVIGKSTSEVYPPAMAASIDAVEDEIFSDGKPVFQELPVPMRDGSTTWVNGVKFLMDLGERRCVGGFFVDVTKRKQADQQKERFLSAIEQSGDMIVIADVDGTIQYQNPMVETVTGYSREDIRRSGSGVFRSHVHDPAFYDSILKTIAAGKTWHGEIDLLTKAGTKITIKSNLSPVRDEDQVVTGFVAVSRDVTHQKELEQTLMQAQRLESIGKLAGGVAHDYNNVLQTILGNSEALSDDPALPEHLSVLVEEVKTAARQSASLTNQLLTFARKQQVEPGPLNINRQLDEYKGMLGRWLGSNVTLDWQPGADLWNVNIDPSQWRQVVTNLCINARDAIADVGTITLKTYNLTFDGSGPNSNVAPGEYVCLEVIDNGCGMSKEVQAHIFEPFYSTQPFGQGTGLGLSTVYGIVKQNQGYIAVESEVGQGSTFKVVLPRETAEETIVPTEDATGMEDNTHQSVLMVEDNEPILRLVKRTLVRQGYDVIATTSPAEALELAADESRRLDILITDIVMPDMNGKELAARVRASRPQLRTIYMSGYTADILKGVDLGETDQFIQKPFTKERLLEALAKLTEG